MVRILDSVEACKEFWDCTDNVSELKIIFYIDVLREGALGLISELPRFSKVGDLSVIVSGRNYKPKLKQTIPPVL